MTNVSPGGIVRRIDELGRVVIPKEIRRRFNIKEGSPLEIKTCNEGILLVLYEEESTREGQAIMEDLNNNNIEGLSPYEHVALKALLGRYLDIKKKDV